MRHGGREECQGSHPNLLSKFQDALRDGLKKSVENDMKGLSEFVKRSLKDLEVIPQSVAEISEATKKWSEISEQSAEKINLEFAIEEKCRLLRSQNGELSPEGAEALRALSKVWDYL